jgi:hypothetical protein
VRKHVVSLTAPQRLPAMGEDIQEPQGPWWTLVLWGMVWGWACDKGKANCNIETLS